MRMDTPAHLVLSLVLLAAATGLAHATDPVDLQVNKQPGGAVALSWDSGAPNFDVYSSSNPQNVVQASNLLLTTQEFEAFDNPQSAITFYNVRSRANCLRPLADAGRVLYGGPLLDESGTPRGSVIVFRARDLDAARAWAQSDPYVILGIFERWEIHESRQVFPGPGV